MSNRSFTQPVCIVIGDSASLLSRRDELAQLADSPGAASSIVQHPDWLVFELQSRGSSAALHVVIATDADGRILGYAPFLIEQHHARVGFGTYHVPIYHGRVLRLLGAGVVAKAGDRVVAEKAIGKALRHDRKARVIRIQEAELPNALARHLSQGSGRFRGVMSNLLDQRHWTIAPQASADAYLAGLGSKRRNDLTRRLRKVYKNLGEQAQLRVFDRPDDIDEYCRLMNQVYARSWHAAAQSIDWELPARRSLFVRLSRSRRLIGHMLMLGTRPIAYVHGYRLGGRYVLDDTGYDEEFGSLGVGSALVFQALQDLFARHPGEVIDFGYGDNQYKRVLATTQNPCGSLYIVRGLGPTVCFSLITPLRWLYRYLRSWKLERAARSPSTGSARSPFKPGPATDDVPADREVGPNASRAS